jgi:hypothetical protein
MEFRILNGVRYWFNPAKGFWYEVKKGDRAISKIQSILDKTF